MKLSVKLFLALVTVLVVLVIIQVFFSERIVRDRKMLENVTSPEVFLSTSTYKQFECKPFTDICVHNITVFIIKSDQYAVFYNKYRVDMEIKQEGHTLSIDSDNEDPQREKRVYIFMPEDPAKIVLDNTSNSDMTIRGMAGRNTTCYFKGKGDYVTLSTNMTTLNLMLDSVRLLLHLNDFSTEEYAYTTPAVSELPVEDTVSVTGKKVNEIPKAGTTDIFVDARNNSNFEISDAGDRYINLSLYLKKSSFDVNNYSGSDQSQVYKNINIVGELGSNYNSGISLGYDTSHTVFRCDSLMINVWGDSSQSFGLTLPEKIESKYRSIHQTENVSITYYHP